MHDRVAEIPVPHSCSVICLTLRVEASFTYISLFIRQRRGLHHPREKSNRCLGYEGLPLSS